MMSRHSTTQWSWWTRIWLWGTVFVAGTDGLIWLTTPSLVESPAYDWAGNILPGRWFGVIWCAVAILCVRSLAVQVRSTTDLALIRVAMALHSITAGLVGLSILHLTLSGGVQSALTGSTKWWYAAAFPIVLLARPALTIAADSDEVEG